MQRRTWLVAASPRCNTLGATPDPRCPTFRCSARRNRRTPHNKRRSWSALGFGWVARCSHDFSDHAALGPCETGVRHARGPALTLLRAFYPNRDRNTPNVEASCARTTALLESSRSLAGAAACGQFWRRLPHRGWCRAGPGAEPAFATSSRSPVSRRSSLLPPSTPT